MSRLVTIGMRKETHDLRRLHEWLGPALDPAADLALIIEIDFPTNHPFVDVCQHARE